MLNYKVAELRTSHFISLTYIHYEPSIRQHSDVRSVSLNKAEHITLFNSFCTQFQSFLTSATVNSLRHFLLHYLQEQIYASDISKLATSWLISLRLKLFYKSHNTQTLPFGQLLMRDKINKHLCDQTHQVGQLLNS